ncbi:MAG: S-methyl-5'-thioadenosine phosphorylase [Thermodesulfobacteriota bacterium]|nr:S-methyl-5'-thioadenosine phosphorylase [Thermodesulfobacteriota bacterium]
MKKRIGVIGGSGLYEMTGLEEIKETKVSTPFGNPSDHFIVGNLKGQEMVFLARHGRGHRIIPSEINFRANIYGMKTLGVEWIISVSAVGSMKENLPPGHILIPHQFIDRTKKRESTFFGNGIVAHVTFADPICPILSNILFSAGCKINAPIDKEGIYLCIEGPQFSSRAESNLYRQWGVDVIGMTNIPEAKLAREAEICYATLALVTDYDCWHEVEEDVHIEMVLEILQKNTVIAQEIIRTAVPEISHTRTCICSHSLQNAIITSPESIPEEKKKELDIFIGAYV